MVIFGGYQAELGEDVADVLLDGLVGRDQRSSDGCVGAALPSVRAPVGRGRALDRLMLAGLVGRPDDGAHRRFLRGVAMSGDGRVDMSSTARGASRRMMTPATRTPAPVTMAATGSMTARATQPTRPATASGRGQRRCVSRKREAGGVGDGVVGEDGDAGEADGSSEVDGGGEHDDDGGDEQLGAQRDGAALVDVGEPVRQLVAAGHRQDGAGDAGNEVEQHAERGDAGTDVDDGGEPMRAVRWRRRDASGASLAAMVATGTVARSVTPTMA